MILSSQEGTGTFSNDERSGFFCEGFQNPFGVAEAAAGDGTPRIFLAKRIEKNPQSFFDRKKVDQVCRRVSASAMEASSGLNTNKPFVRPPS